MSVNLVEIGSFVNTHGIKGELKLKTDEHVEDLLSLEALYVDGVAHAVAHMRIHKGMLLVVLDGIDDINAALPYKGKVVYADADDAGLDDGFMLIDEIIGSDVYTESGELLGKVSEVIQSKANDVYVVSQSGSERLIPAVDEFVVSMDRASRRIVVRLIPGM